MIKEINKIPINTTKNFQVNSMKLDIDVPKSSNHREYKITNYETKSKNRKKKITSKIGIEYEEYKETNIIIEKNHNLEKTIIIEYEFNKDTLIDNINIELRENSKANIIIVYTGYTPYHQLIINNEIKENSNLSLSIVNLIDKNSKNFVAVSNKVYDNAEIHTNIVELEGKVKVSNYYSELLGYQSKDFLKSIYYGNDEDKIDINYDVKNIEKNSISDIEVVGLLDGKSEKTIRMNIDFISGCSKSVGEEREKCILLSDDAVSKSVPILLCGEEDVQGVHSVATGKVDNEKLFYCMSRGLNYKEAIKMLLHGDLNKVINQIPNKDIIEEINKKINAIL